MRISKRIVFCSTILACVYFGSTSDSGTRVIYEVNVCTEEHRFRCQEGELISLTNLSCGSGSACPQTVNRTLFDLCQGQQTCSNLGLAEMLDSRCGPDVTKKDSLHVKFSCLPGSTSSCRSNICANSSGGLICPKGSLVHIRGMTCGSVTGKCPISTYTNMQVCEGVNHCAASGLSALLPQSCQRDVGWERNVIVNYICVSERQIENTCTSDDVHMLDNEFGILRSLFGEPDAGHKRTSCTWRINSSGDKNVKVVVHMIHAKVPQGGCDPRVLSITFVDCRDGLVMTKWFCNMSSSGTELISCGHVWIRSTIPPGEEPADMFVVSYQTYSSNVPNEIPQGLPSCLAPPKISTIQTTSQPSTYTIPVSRTSLRPSPKSMSVGRNYGPGDGLFEYRDSAAYEEDAAGTDNHDDTSTLSKHLRLMILYIFFGVVILVLAVALIAVIVSYHKISKFKGHRFDSSEKTVLWTHNEDTPLETFLNNNLVESSGTLASETVCAFKAGYETDQVVATVHCEAVAEQDESPTRLSIGSGVSTFLAGRRDSHCRDLTRSTHSGSFASNISYKDVADTDQNNGYNNIGAGGYLEIGDKSHYDMPKYCDNNIYETIDVDNLKINRREKGNCQCDSINPDTYMDKNYEDKTFGFANNDTAAIRLQDNPLNNLHYHVNNDEYAVVSKTCKPMTLPNTPNYEAQQLSNHCMDSEDNIDFRPTSGPYDKNRRSTDDSNVRWSKGERRRWTDEV